MPDLEKTKGQIRIIDELRSIIAAMENGDYTESSAATLITRDKDTGIVTIVSMTEGGIDQRHLLFAEMAKHLGYARVN